jgi:uncharacterized membrane protein (UPF0127 family)
MNETIVAVSRTVSPWATCGALMRGAAQYLAPQGMLFVYPDQKPRGVWMKNTLLPLDVLFLNHKAEIVAMLPDLQPCRQNPCPIYNSQLPATYMLEVNAGFINNHQLKIGQTLNLPF